MFEAGQKFRFKGDDESFKDREIFTIVAVSAHVPMVKIDGGWVWADGIELIEKPADPIEEQLNFLGLN